MGILKRLLTGLPSTIEDCDCKIASKQAEIARIQAQVSASRSKDFKNGGRREIAKLKGDIARLRAHRKSLIYNEIRESKSKR